MKVLLINGSPKEHGNTFQALSEVAKTLNAEGIETEIDLGVLSACHHSALLNTDSRLPIMGVAPYLPLR